MWCVKYINSVQTPSYNAHIVTTQLCRSNTSFCHVTTLLVPGLHSIFFVSV